MKLSYPRIILLLAVLFILLSCKNITESKIQPLQNSSLNNKTTGNTFFVSPEGNDKNSGSMDNPWRTIQHASDVMNAGDITYIRKGIYKEKVTTTKNGIENNYITFAGYENEKALIQSDSRASGNGFIIANSFIKLENLIIRNFESGIWAEGNIGFIEINKCEVYDCVFGIGLQNVHDFILSNDLMHHNGSQDGVGFNFDATPAEGSSCYNGKIMNCISHTQVGKDNCDGFALGHEGVRDVVFSDCETYGVYDGFDMSGKNIKLIRCIAHHCFGGGGYKLWQDDITLINCIAYSNSTSAELDWGVRPVTAKLINCTFYNSEVYNIWIENRANKLEMYNCILSGRNNSGLWFEQPFVDNYKGDYNLFGDIESRTVVIGGMEDIPMSDMKNGVWTKKTGQDSHSIFEANPTMIFISPSDKDADLHLKNGSQAINNGTSQNAPSEDFSKCQRSDGKIDIGAYEFGDCSK